MTQVPYAFDRDSVDKLTRSHSRTVYQDQNVNSRGTGETVEFDSPSPSVHLGRVSEPSNIAGWSMSSDDAPSKGDVDVWRISRVDDAANRKLVQANWTRQKVYNLCPYTLKLTDWVTLFRDHYGQWFVTGRINGAGDTVLHGYLSSRRISTAGSGEHDLSMTQRLEEGDVFSISSNELVFSENGYYCIDHKIGVDIDTFSANYGNTSAWWEMYDGASWNNVDDSLIQYKYENPGSYILGSCDQRSGMFGFQITDKSIQKLRWRGITMASGGSASITAYFEPQTIDTGTIDNHKAGTSFVVFRPIGR